MERGILLAWAAGLGLMTVRELQQVRRPPPPGRYLAASGIFAGLALLANYGPAAPAAALTAWGFDLAIFLQVLPETVAGAKTKGSGKGKTTTTTATGGGT